MTYSNTFTPPSTTTNVVAFTGMPKRTRNTAKRMLPGNGDGSTLSLDFTTGVLDPRLSFTRTTNATFINSQGLVQYAASNIMTFSEDQGNNTTWSAFGTSVTRTTGQSDPFGGTAAVRLAYDATSSDAVISRSVSVQQGISYVLSIWIRADSGTLSNVRVGRSAAATGALFPSLTTTWQRVSLPFTATGTTDGIEVRVLTFGSPKTATFHVFGAQLEPGSTVNAYQPSLAAVAYQAPRFDYDPTELTPRGLLIEGSASTLNQYSEDFSNAYWSKPNASVSSTSVTGPDNVAGTTRRIVEDNTTNQHGLRRSFSMTSGVTYTMSVFVKPGSYDLFGFEMYASASNNAKAEVTSISGNTHTVTSASGVNATLARTPMAASGWYRYALTFTSTATQSGDFNILIKQTNSYAGNGTNYMDVYGFMLEPGFGASSYIPTGANTGNRAEDLCVMDNITSLQYSTTNGSMYYEGRFSKLNTASFPWRMGFTTESGDHRVFGLLTNSAGSSIEAKGPSSTPTASVGVSLALNTDYKLAWGMDTSLATGEVRRFINGGAVSVSGATALTVTGTPTYFMFGQKGYGLWFPSGTIKAAKYWPTTLSDTQLQAITT